MMLAGLQSQAVIFDRTAVSPSDGVAFKAGDAAMRVGGARSFKLDTIEYFEYGNYNEVR